MNNMIWTALLLAAWTTGAKGSTDRVTTPSPKKTDLLPAGPLPVDGLSWFVWLYQHYPVWFQTTPRERADPKPWPDGFDPASDPVFAHNSLVIPAVTPHQVLTALLTIKDWKNYYPNGGDGVVVGEDGQQQIVDRLSPGLHYDWTTFSVVQHVRVSEVVDDAAGAALAWTGDSPGTRFYHRWMLTADGAGGTVVTTEECQQGVLAALDAFLMNPALHAAHQLWLTQLQKWLVLAGRARIN